MRLELDSNLLFMCLGAFFLTFWFVRGYCQSRLLALIAKCFVGALALPALIPGHGEIVVIAPSASLFAVSATSAHVIGLLFFIVNFSVLMMLFKWLARKF